MRSKYLLSIFLLFCLACSKKESEKITIVSPDRSVEVNIKGTKASFADPFITDIEIKAFGNSETVSTEVYAEELSQENIEYEWRSNKNLRLSFHQQDDTQRSFLIHVDETGISLKETP